ncbi:MAG: hypothetical protein ACO28S_04830 [Bacteroidia bacterium]
MIDGGADNDTITANNGTNTIDAGTGNDTIRLNNERGGARVGRWSLR